MKRHRQKRKLRLRHVIVFGCAAISGGVLLHVSQRVQIAEGRLEALRHGVAVEEDSLRVLRAEWAFLNSPQRLDGLASRFLGMQPAAASGTLTDAGDMPVLSRAAAEERVDDNAVEATP